ncbi:MAG TPA: tol-pal system protein YbgF [Thermoanaerobaculia bacterium]|nr:tol-pal system protein YbgF [Thermoanaerobaculia bacterium]
MSRLAAVAVLLLAACASAPPDDTTSLVPPAQVGPPGDQRLAEMQTTMTELLERIDVLNDRIAKLENATPPAPASAPMPVVVRQPPPAPEPPQVSQPVPVVQASRALAGAQLADDYRNAIMLYGKNRMADARRAFQGVYDAEPSGELADNALYWIGETYFAGGDYSNAMRYYHRVTTEFSEQNKAPDALFKTGIALAKTGDLALARKTFDEVIAKYPYSTYASSARQELKRIKY